MENFEKFEIETDPTSNLLRITMRGHWDIQTVKDYKTAVMRAVGGMYQMGCGKGEILALVDARSGGAQSQDVISFYQAEMGDGGLTPRSSQRLSPARCSRCRSNASPFPTNAYSPTKIRRSNGCYRKIEPEKFCPYRS